MDITDKYSPILKKEILSHFRKLMRECGTEYDKKSLALVKKSFEFLLTHTSEEQEYYGIQLIKFSSGLAFMTVRELGLDAIGVSAALLLHCVERNDIPGDELARGVGKRTATVIEEVLKISKLDTTTNQGQAENMRNLILTLASDFRVILLKIAERLYLMRQMELLKEKEQIELSSAGTLQCDVRNGRYFHEYPGKGGL